VSRARGGRGRRGKGEEGKVGKAGGVVPRVQITNCARI